MGKILQPYRVLDLSDEKGMYAGQVLGTLGADVIKVEPPGGSSARYLPPFYQDKPGTDNSLYWAAYNTNKRSITLDIQHQPDQTQLITLAKTADIIIESFPPGYMFSLGLGYEHIETVNPDIIMTSITPFGQNGPHATFKGNDLTCWAAGGLLSQSGDPDRPPVRTSHIHLSYLMASLDAAWLSLVALYWRNASGLGQYIDISIQESVLKTTFIAHEYWEATGCERTRGSTFYTVPATEKKLRIMWPLADGYLYKMFSTSELSLRENPLIIEWMAREGSVSDYLKRLDWTTLDWKKKTEAEIAAIEGEIGKFFQQKTKSQVMKEAFSRNIAMQTVNSPYDILEHPQLDARRYWHTLTNLFSNQPLRYPKRFYLSSETECGLWYRAPRAGEHTTGILEEIASVDHSHLNTLRPSGKTPPSALHDVKVVTFEHGLMVPMLTSLLASFGATVVRVESSIHPDWHRQAGPFMGNINNNDRSVTYLFVNSGKLGITINLRHKEGIELARRIAAWADLVTENFAGGVMNRLGLGYQQLREVNPDLIMLSTGAYGQTGPYASMRGHGGPLVCLTGLSYITGYPDQPPQLPGFALTDFTAPRAALVAVMAALDYRQRTGKGQYLDFSQFESTVHLLAPLLLDCQVNQRELSRIGNRSPIAAPQGVYPCRGHERWCAIAVDNQEQWLSFVRVMGNPAWAESERFQTPSQRLANHDELDSRIAGWTSNQEAHYVVNLLQQMGVPASVVQNGSDLNEDPQLAYRGFLRTLKHDDVCGGFSFTYTGVPAVMSRTPYHIARAPRLGEHTDKVLSQITGIATDEIDDLHRRGVLN